MLNFKHLLDLLKFTFSYRFLLYEVKPATSHEVNAIDKLKLLYTETLFKRMAKKILRDIKCQKVRNSEKLMVGYIQNYLFGLDTVVDPERREIFPFQN